MPDITPLEAKAMAGDAEAIATMASHLRQANALIDEAHEALREFVEYDAEAEGDQSLGDCDRVWNKAETAFDNAKRFRANRDNGA